MPKLLHEKLREWAKDDCYAPASIIALKDACNEEAIDAFTMLADEIERDYLPIPCDSDGKPWKLYERAIDCVGTEFIVQGVGYDNAGYPYLVNVDSGTIYYHKWCTHLSQTIVDVDGVEINVGDTVWHIGDGSRGTIVSLTTDGRWSSYPIKVDWDKGDEGFYAGTALTHKEPDSLVKLYHDIDTTAKQASGSMLRDKASEWGDRLSALIERGK